MSFFKSSINAPRFSCLAWFKTHKERHGVPCLPFIDQSYCRASIVVRDYKLTAETSVRRGILFAHFMDVGEARTALQLCAQMRQLLGRAAGKHLHSAVVQITHIAAQMQFFSGVLREIAKPHTLDSAGDEVPLGLLRLAHGM